MALSGIESRHIPACSAVPQPTAPPRGLSDVLNKMCLSACSLVMLGIILYGPVLPLREELKDSVTC